MAPTASLRPRAFSASIKQKTGLINHLFRATFSAACVAINVGTAITPRPTIVPQDGTLNNPYAEISAQQSDFVTHDDDDDDHVDEDALRDAQDGFEAPGHSERNLLAGDLQKCASLLHVRHLHHHIMIDHGPDAYFSSLLISMYAKYGALQDAGVVFDRGLDRNVVIWTAVITAYGRQGPSRDAFKLYRRMQEEGTPPNNVTFIALLSVCTCRDLLTDGKRFHACFDITQLLDVNLSTAVVTMYGKCGSAEDALTIFEHLPNRNIVTWNSMITMYVNQNNGKDALSLFQRLQSEGVKPDDCTYINSLKACASLEGIAEGRAIHFSVVEDGLASDNVVSNALLNMYGKCGASDDALCIFMNMEEHDRVAWNGLITAYGQQGLGAKGLELFRKMQQQGLKPDKVTFMGAIGACASLSALEEGKSIHACLLDDALMSDLQVRNALIHMYGRCGALDSALSIFAEHPSHDVVSWTTIIAAFSQQGHAKAALQLFKAMQSEHVKPDEVTYITVLNACSHAGLVEEGRSCFVTMEEQGLTPNVEHYVCMIDLLGRAGLLAEAEEFIGKMPHWHDGRLWAPLLGSCTIHSDTSRGKIAAEQMLKLGPRETAPYVLLANLCAANVKKDYAVRKGGDGRMSAIIDEMVTIWKGQDGGVRA